MEELLISFTLILASLVLSGCLAWFLVFRPNREDERRRSKENLEYLERLNRAREILSINLKDARKIKEEEI